MRKTTLRVLPTFWPPFQKSAIVTLPPPPFTKLLLSSACCKSQWATPSTTRSSLSFLKACGQDFKSQAPAIAVTRYFLRENLDQTIPYTFTFTFIWEPKRLYHNTLSIYIISISMFSLLAIFSLLQMQSSTVPPSPPLFPNDPQ